jgi:anti-sigma regulatory factor (Ser/Thr protein kinase)
MVEAGRRSTSAAYDDPFTTAGSFNRPLPDPPADAATLTYRDQTCLVEVRRFVTDHAAAAGLAADRAAGLTVAVNELASNTLEHTNDGGHVTIWTEQRLLICQVHDNGHLTDLLAGRIPAAADAPSGRGLLLVNQICDLVRIHTGPGHTTIRLHTHL